MAGAAIFHDLRDLLGRNLTPQIQEGKLRLTWGFAFNILALLSHVLVVLVLVLAPSAQEAGDGDDDAAAQGIAGGERISRESGSPSAPPAGTKGGESLKEPLLTLEEG